MPRLFDLIDAERQQRQKQMTHISYENEPYYSPEQRNQLMSEAVRSSQVPASIRGQEKGLGGGFDLFEVGGVPVNLTDISPKGALAGMAAMGGKIGAMKLGALTLGAPLAATAIGSQASKGSRLSALAMALKGQQGVMSGTVKSNKERLEKLLGQSGIDFDVSKSAKSPSTYYTLKKPDGDSLKIRISDHHDYHAGGDVSVDPETGLSLKDAIGELKKQGIPIQDRIKNSKKIMDDETMVNLFYGQNSGKSINDVPPYVQDMYRTRHEWKIDPRKPQGGYWTEKK